MVTLRQADGHQEKPLPGREFLDTHFRLYEIFHASGLAKEVEDNYRRWDQIKQQASGHSLLEDGSTNVAEILQTALFGVAKRRIEENDETLRCSLDSIQIQLRFNSDSIYFRSPYTYIVDPT
ncbi:hypothetical protein ACN38_g9454 [Penicillium nordicum]|uniref:Uncharacterized protein n=1 Tax=Penicillium nordicum TaxID=229535 RepID=A0A0M8P354_9EURO|nr:hypothetical protein ACN38_g9454 [Penicillium nordicum]